MTDTPIRTHADCVRTAHLTAPFTLVPTDWAPDTPLLVVAGLPEGSTIKRLCDVPAGWQWFTMGGEWKAAHPADTIPRYTGFVVCRPVPVPAPPATERVPWHEAIGKQAHYVYETTSGTAAEIKGALFDHPGSPRGFVVDRNRNRICDIDADGMVEVLVEAPTGDGEPDYPLIDWRKANREQWERGTPGEDTAVTCRECQGIGATWVEGMPEMVCAACNGTGKRPVGDLPGDTG